MANQQEDAVPDFTSKKFTVGDGERDHPRAEKVRVEGLIAGQARATKTIATKTIRKNSKETFVFDNISGAGGGGGASNQNLQQMAEDLVKEKTFPPFPTSNTDGQRVFKSGSTRNKDADDFRFDLIPAVALKRIAKIFAEGGKIHGDRNWEKGQPVEVVLNHGIGHLQEWMSGCRKEDHLAKMAWAMLAIMYYEENGIDQDKTFENFQKFDHRYHDDDQPIARYEEKELREKTYEYENELRNKILGARSKEDGFKEGIS